MKGMVNMVSSPDFEWQQSIVMGEKTFLKYFAKANELSEGMALPITMMNKERQVGIFYSTQAYDNLLKQINSLKQEILTLAVCKIKLEK